LIFNQNNRYMALHNQENWINPREIVAWKFAHKSHRDTKIISIILAALTFIITQSAWAGFTCSDIHGEQIRQPLLTNPGRICFIKQPILDQASGTPTDAEEINLYFIPKDGKPEKAKDRGLLYDESPGQIVDAFLLQIGGDDTRKIAIIQSIEIRNSLAEPNSSGKYYSVAIFDQSDTSLQRNERASEWFGDGYSKVTSGDITYEFPYTTRESIEMARTSSFSLLMARRVAIPVKIKAKSYLYEGPNIQDRTKRYLIRGDNAMVDKATGGWCHVNYNGRRGPLQMWLMCDALAASR